MVTKGKSMKFKEYDMLDIAYFDVHLMKDKSEEDGKFWYIPNVSMNLNIEGKEDTFGLLLPFFDVYETVEEAAKDVLFFLHKIETDFTIEEVLVFDLQTGEQIEDETVFVEDLFGDDSEEEKE